MNESTIYFVHPDRPGQPVICPADDIAQRLKLQNEGYVQATPPEEGEN